MPAGIVVRDEDERSGDARVAQMCDAFLDETFSNSLPVVRRRHRQMVDQAPATVVPAEHRSHDSPVLFRDATKAWIAQKVSAYFLFRIALGYLYSFNQVPKRHRLLVVIEDKFPGADGSHIPALRLSYARPEIDAPSGCDAQIRGMKPDAQARDRKECHHPRD